jgi:hypothetical protein
MPPSFTHWNRFEPSPHGAPLEDALHARLHDPLWLLGRQWQTGEFRGEDAGSPVAARLRSTTRALTAWHAGRPTAGSSATGAPYDPIAQPLEAVVQAETWRTTANGNLAAIGEAARAALDWTRALRAVLEAEGVQASDVDAVVAGYRKLHPLDEPDPTELAELAAESQTWLLAAAQRSFDGRALAHELIQQFATEPPVTLPADPAMPSGTEQPVAAAAQRWLARWPTIVAAPAPPATWDEARLEYRFALGTATGKDDLTVLAPDWDGGRLDWHTFERDPGTTLTGGTSTAAQQRVDERLPVEATYPGMPLARWWAFENASVSLGSVDAGPDDLARLLLLDFALLYGNDFFLLPLTLPIGSLTTVDSLVVTDTFGIRTLVEPASNHPDRPWSAWTLSDAADATAAAAGTAGLLLVPALADALTSEPLERVRLLRDEMADLVWAVERELRDEAALPVDRAERYAARRRGATQPPPQEGIARYRIESAVPDYWYPMAAEVGPDGTWLELQVLPDVDTGALSPPRGQLLAGGLRIFEEEIGRDGVELTRQFKRARWSDRSTHVWLARRRGIGRGEGSSALVFDRLDEPAS